MPSYFYLLEIALKSGSSLCRYRSRRLVHKRACFSEEDRILIKNVYELKGYGAKRLIKKFPLKAGNYEC